MVPRSEVERLGRQVMVPLRILDLALLTLLIDDALEANIIPARDREGYLNLRNVLHQIVDTDRAHGTVQ
jgi:hypothetical protein